MAKSTHNSSKSSRSSGSKTVCPTRGHSLSKNDTRLTKSVVSVPSFESQISTDPEDIKDVQNVYRNVKLQNGEAKTIIFAVVKDDQIGTFNQRVSQRKKKMESSLVVTSPGNLQAQIDRYLNGNKFRTCCLVVNANVEGVTYNIPKTVWNVQVIPCGDDLGTRPNALRIGSKSTYCGFKAYAWHARENLKGYRLTHQEGCFFDIRDDRDAVLDFIRQPTIVPDMTDEMSSKIMGEFEKLTTEDPESQSENVRGNKFRSSTTENNETQAPWFQRWKAFIAACFGVGGFFAGIGGAFWCGGSGIYMTGPHGFKLAAGCFSMMGIGGAAVARAAVVGITAATAVYYIPWDRVFDFFRITLKEIWQYVKDTFNWFWEKLKQFKDGACSMVGKMFRSFTC
ncbi:hypothetical protein F4805DRAFT_431944 [Annulohypoxylon moriforme]|nr:hypothetical protein F4805DRAFT_431944 [Annulohypoxylon moriforme]